VVVHGAVGVPPTAAAPVRRRTCRRRCGRPRREGTGRRRRSPPTVPPGPRRERAPRTRCSTQGSGGSCGGRRTYPDPGRARRGTRQRIRSELVPGPRAPAARRAASRRARGLGASLWPNRSDRTLLTYRQGGSSKHATRDHDGGRQERSTTARLYRWNPVTAYAHDAGTHRGPRLCPRHDEPRTHKPRRGPRIPRIYNRLTDRLATVYGVDSDGDTGVIPRRRHATSSSPAARESWDSRPRSPRWSSPDRGAVSLEWPLRRRFRRLRRGLRRRGDVGFGRLRRLLPLAELESVLADDDREFDLATMVHCETPTGTLNDLGPRSTSSMRPTRRSSPSSTPSRRSAASGCRQDGSTSVSAPLRSASARRRGSLPPRSATARGRRWRSGTRIRCTQISSRGETLQRGSRTPTLRPRSWRSTRRSGCS